MDPMMEDALRELLRDRCSPAQVRAIEAGGPPQALWRDLHASGFADALVAEAQGGAGLALAEVFPLMMLCGAHTVPVPLAQTMLARARLSRAGLPCPQGSIALAAESASEAGGLRCALVPYGRVADWVLVDAGATAILLPVAAARSGPGVFVLDASLAWDGAALAQGVQLPHAAGTRLLLACSLAAQVAGALVEVLMSTLRHANERQQFGRPIGKFQAIQHQLSVMAEHVLAARMAAQLGCASATETPDRLRVAVAKARASEAALEVANIAHAIHGAIGFTAEFDLQLFTRRLHAWRLAAGAESSWHAELGEALVGGHDGIALDLLRSLADPPHDAPT